MLGQNTNSISEKYSGRPAREPSHSGNDLGGAADIQRRGRSRAPRPQGSSLCNEVHPGHEPYIRQYRDSKTAPVGASIYGRLNPRDERYPLETLALPDPALPYDGSRSEAKSRARSRVSTRIPSQPTLVPEDSISNDGRPFEQLKPETRGRSKAPSHAQSRYGRDDYPSTVKPAETTLSYREHEARARSRAPTITQPRYERQEHAPPTQPERPNRSVHPSTWFRRRQSSPAGSIVHAHGRDQYDLNPTYTYKPAGQQADSARSVTHAHGNDPYDLNPTRTYQHEQPRQSVAPAARSSASRRQSVAPDYRSSASRREPEVIAPRSSASRRKSVAPAYMSSTSRREPEAPAARSSASRRQSVAPDHRSSTSRREPEALPARSSASRRQSVAPIPRSSVSRREQMPVVQGAGYQYGTGPVDVAYGGTLSYAAQYSAGSVRSSNYGVDFAYMHERMRRL